MPEGQEIVTSDDSPKAVVITDPRPQEHNPSREGWIFKPGEAFTKDKIATTEKDVVIERPLTPFETAYTFKDHAYIVWTQGPKKGRVFRVESVPTEEQIERIPSAADIQTKIVQELRELDHLAATYKELVNNSGTTDAIEQKKVEIYMYLYRLYYGNEHTAGLEKAQLFELEGRGQEYYDLLSRIIPRGEEPRGVKHHGYPYYLAAIAEQEGLSSAKDQIKRDDINEQNRAREINKFFDLGGERYYDPKHPIILTHGAYSFMLPNAIQLGGLAAKDYFERFGIKKLLGGEGGGTFSYIPSEISFWYHPDGQIPRIGGYGCRENIFEYPIAFGIDEEHAKNLSLEFGTMHEVFSERYEMTLKDFLSFDSITHIFVPDFKVEEVKTSLADHGVNNIHIGAFNEPVPEAGEPKLPPVNEDFDRKIKEAIATMVDLELTIRKNKGLTEERPLRLARHINMSLRRLRKCYKHNTGIEAPTDPPSMVRMYELLLEHDHALERAEIEQEIKQEEGAKFSQ